MRESLNREDYLRGLLGVIHVCVKRCNWKVTLGEPYGYFTLYKTRELLENLTSQPISDSDVTFASTYIASKIEALDV